MNKKIVLSLLTASLLTVNVAAEEAKVSDVEAEYSAKSNVEASDVLKQSINFGFSNTTGNTKNLNFNGKYTASFTTVGYDNEALKVAFDAAAYYDKSNSVTTNEEYVANLGLEQYLMNDWLGYGAVNWLRNPDFKDYDNKFAIGAGLGKMLFNDGKHSFKVKLGAAYNIEDYASAIPTNKFASLNEYVEYNNQLNAVSSLYIKVGAMENFEDFSNDYQVLAVAGLNFVVAENINVTLEEEVSYDHLPPVGFEKTDTKSIVRVGYNF